MRAAKYGTTNVTGATERVDIVDSDGQNMLKTKVPIFFYAIAVFATFCIASISNHGSTLADQALPAFSQMEIEETSTSFLHPPHIVLVTLDDVGHNDVGWQSTDMPGATPIMTAMARDGIIMSNYYGQPSCSPARATLMSGRFIHRTGFQDLEVAPFSNYSLSGEFTLLPAAMTLMGYKTYGMGKWNIGHCNEVYLPWNRGFDSFLGMVTAGIGYFTHDHGDYTYDGAEYTLYDMLEGNSTGQYTTGEAYQGLYDTILFGERACTIVRDHVALDVEAPLFIWLAFHGVHSDSGYAEEDSLTSDNVDYLAELKDAGMTKSRMEYARGLMAVDNAVSSVKEALISASIMNNTVMVIHSDNGAQPCVSEMAGNNWPLRSAKFQYFDGGVRVPAMVYAPGFFGEHQIGTTFRGLIHHVDWYPTFLALANSIDSNLTADLDGVNQWQAIMGLKSAPRKEIVLDLSDVAVINRTRTKVSYDYAVIAYIYTDMKLLENVPTDIWYLPNETYPATCTGRACKISGWMSSDTDSCGWGNFLFNLTADPYERNNLYYNRDYSDQVRDLQSRAQRQFADEHFQSVKWGDASQGVAADHFKAAGDYAVPWGCSADVA